MTKPSLPPILVAWCEPCFAYTKKQEDGTGPTEFASCNADSGCRVPDSSRFCLGGISIPEQSCGLSADRNLLCLFRRFLCNGEVVLQNAYPGIHMFLLQQERRQQADHRVLRDVEQQAVSHGALKD